jgi:hypothetical protein
MRASRRTVLGTALGAVLAGSVLAAPGARSQPTASDAQDGLVEAAHAYQTSLERLAAVREAELSRASQKLDRYRDLHARGLVARRDAEDAARGAAEARARLEETRRDLTAAEALIAEAEARRQIALLGPSAPDDVRATDTLVRYDGSRSWTLRDLAGVERFFAVRFGRSLPVSALGQTLVHDRLGFDHGQAVDVAVHPDSDEGRALIAHLRAGGIPFLAFRSAVGGASTGAHVHIGLPSGRLGAAR